MIDYIIACLLGIIVGTITGMIPGIHTNLVMAIIISSTFLLSFPITILIIFITSAAVTHTFVDFIPSIYFGAPTEDTLLSALPGHQYLLQGKAHEAICLTAIGSLLAIFLLIIIIPIFLFGLPILYPFIKILMSFILILALLFLIYTEKSSKFWAIIIILLSGTMGMAIYNSNINQPLLPLLTGMFGFSTIIFSIQNSSQPPPQTIKKTSITKKEIISPALNTLLISPLCSLFPGVGSSQAATIATEINKNQNTKQFLILLGSINTLVLSTSFITLYLINKSRTGVANAISQITNLGYPELKIILITIFITSIIAYFLTIKISKIIASKIDKLNYNRISFIVLLCLLIINIAVSGIIGILILIPATSLGLLAIKTNIKRSHLMSSILIPTIFYYLPI